MKKNEMKQIPMKNYIIVAIYFLVTIGATLVIREWYHNYQEYQLTIPVISGQLQEINIEEFRDYITEHDNFYLYIGVAEDENCRELEKDLASLLTDKNIKNETIYLNITDLLDREQQLNDVLTQYNSISSSIGYPSFLMIQDKKVVDFVTSQGNEAINIGDIEKMLDEYEVGM